MFWTVVCLVTFLSRSWSTVQGFDHYCCSYIHLYLWILHLTLLHVNITQSKDNIYLGVCAKVKRRCRARLRFIRSLRNSSGEWQGEPRGETRRDMPGDPWGERDGDFGPSLIGWMLLKVSVSPELSHRASLMSPFKKTKLPFYADKFCSIVSCDM